MSDIAVQLNNLGKMYRLYRRQGDKMLDAFGINRWLFWRKNYYQEFWALREISLNIRVGERIGIIGPNGAGKSTLLKILCGNVHPTEGSFRVNGSVQALLELGTGFHPEFTGRQNIRASLALQGFTPTQIAEKEAEIEDFAELEEFMDQPIKTYSAGMHARLAFSTATAVEPEILIIDEVLGAGDAYFAGKCVERMEKLTDYSGVTVLFVSHDLNSVQRLCDITLWIERGRIRMAGPSLEVIKQYSKHVQIMEDRRLRAKNRKWLTRGYQQSRLEGYADAMVVSLNLTGEPGVSCDINEISLLKDGEIEETLRVGDAQDTNSSLSSALSLHGSHWSEPRRGGDGYYRTLEIPKGDRKAAGAMGQAVFYLYTVYSESRYSFRVRYRMEPSSKLTLSVFHDGSSIQVPLEVPCGSTGWTERECQVPVSKPQNVTPAKVGEENAPSPSLAKPRIPIIEERERQIVKWPGEGSLSIEKVLLLGEGEVEQSVFLSGSPLTLRIFVIANKSDTFEVLPAAVLYRIDGVLVSNNQGPLTTLHLEAGEHHAITVCYGPLNLGDGAYVFSVAVYKNLSPVGKSVYYDLIDRSYQFQVIGNPPFNNGVFSHPADWQYSVVSGTAKEDQNLFSGTKLKAFPAGEPLRKESPKK
jgi:lipopolysaccharide transport system ATP-binding protein